MNDMKRKQSLYFPDEMLQEIVSEARRQDRSLSWIVQQAWKISKHDIQVMPAVSDVLGEILDHTPKPVATDPDPETEGPPSAAQDFARGKFDKAN